jgi:glycosyltransferase involved in cell wall biosynthesis
MRVLVLNWRDIENPTAGGSEAVVENMLRGLSALGHEVTLFTSEFENCKKFEKTGHGTIIRKGSMNTVYLHALLYLLGHRKDFDFVIESVSAVPFFTPLCFDSNRIIIIPHHLVGKVVFEEVPFPKALLAYCAERSIPFVYRNAKFIAVSGPVKEDLSRFGVDPRRISVCYFGLSPLFKAKRKRKFGKPTLVTVARLRRYKRVDLLLEMFKRVLEKVDSRLIIIGTGPELPSLKRKAKQLGISNKVRFTGFVDDAEKEDLLSRSWVFVTASEREGFGIGALESESSGTPVVAFRIGGLKDAIKDKYSGFLAQEGDADSFVRLTLRLLRDAQLRSRMSQNAARYSCRFERSEAIRKIDGMMRKNNIRG